MSTATVVVRASRAEWSRIWSVRSSWVCVAAIALAVVGLGTVAGLDAANNPGQVQEGDGTAWDVAGFTAMFALFGTLAMSVVASTSDHATGAIVPTLQWTPRRGLLLAVRTSVITATVTLVGVAFVAVASVAVWAVAPGLDLPAAEGARSLGNTALVLCCAALLAIGLGLATRSTAAAVVIAVALLVFLPVFLGQLPYDWAVTVARHLPGAGVLLLLFGDSPFEGLTVTAARVTMAVWAAGALAIGGWRLVRKDAV
jgi:ABC-2 type transport system permease protein